MNLIWFFMLFPLNIVLAWDSEQLEVFDVVEEVKQNFYELLNISQDATSQQIRSAFRTLSLKLHPDKNLNEDTSEQFRNLVSVYEILRSPAKRKYYDEVLINGLPNWKSAVYYYRYARKLGLAEVCLILFFIFSVAQYLINWASYLEKNYNIQQLAKSKKKSRKVSGKEEPAIFIPKPSLKDTLPIQIPRFVWYILTSIPTFLKLIKIYITEYLEAAKKPVIEEEEEKIEIPKIKTVRKRNKFIVPEGPNFEVKSSNNINESESGSTNAPPVVSGGLWTDDDLAELIRLVKKYPQGTPKRWENIGEALGRSVEEVTYMANKMKENSYKVPNQQEEEIPQIKVKHKTKKDIECVDDVKNWNQTQQKALEEALTKYSKGCTDRWDKIALCVPDKTKEECMLRYRFLAETVKKQRDSENQTRSE